MRGGPAPVAWVAVPGAGVLDTSTVILLPRLGDPAALPAWPCITAVTLAELSVGPLVTGDEVERARRQAVLQQAEADFEPLPFDAAAARAFGQVAASLRRNGRKPAARAFDALIAASAISRGLPVHTCNPPDFAGIDGLVVVPVPHPDGAPVVGEAPGAAGGPAAGGGPVASGGPAGATRAAGGSGLPAAR